MQRKLVYVELKSGYDDNGPAWIGYGLVNRTGKTIYFNGTALQKGNGVSGNYFSGEDEYWVTGIKKNAEHRYPWGNGKIQIDKDAIAEYKELTGLKELLKSKYEIVQLDNTTHAEYHERQNEKL